MSTFTNINISSCPSLFSKAQTLGRANEKIFQVRTNEFLFMRANGAQLTQISQLIESGNLCLVTDKVFPFDQIAEAFDYMSKGRAKGKVVVRF